MIHPELWYKISNIDLDTYGGPDRFAKMLAEQNDWSLAYAGKAIREYKKFIYLSILSDTQFVAAYPIMKVWQAHLLDTKTYWNDFCKSIGTEVHHNPSLITETNLPDNIDRYAECRELYVSEFGSELDLQFWPLKQDLLAQYQNLKPVDKSLNFIIPKPNGELVRSLFRFAGIAVFPLSVLAYAVTQTSIGNDSNLSWKAWLVVSVVAVLISIFACLVWRMEHQTRREASSLDAG